jgi:hypothetical protein
VKIQYLRLHGTDQIRETFRVSVRMAVYVAGSDDLKWNDVNVGFSQERLWLRRRPAARNHERHARSQSNNRTLPRPVMPRSPTVVDA